MTTFLSRRTSSSIRHNGSDSAVAAAAVIKTHQGRRVKLKQHNPVVTNRVKGRANVWETHTRLRGTCLQSYKWLLNYCCRIRQPSLNARGAKRRAGTSGKRSTCGALVLICLWITGSQHFISICRFLHSPPTVKKQSFKGVYYEMQRMKKKKKELHPLSSGSMSVPAAVTLGTSITTPPWHLSPRIISSFPFIIPVKWHCCRSWIPTSNVQLLHLPEHSLKVRMQMRPDSCFCAHCKFLEITHLCKKCFS